MRVMLIRSSASWCFDPWLYDTVKRMIQQQPLCGNGLDLFFFFINCVVLLRRPRRGRDSQSSAETVGRLRFRHSFTWASVLPEIQQGKGIVLVHADASPCKPATDDRETAKYSFLGPVKIKQLFQGPNIGILRWTTRLPRRYVGVHVSPSRLQSRSPENFDTMRA
ncbi:hypothetical protein GW17_00055788 [Ensete ventricosum]|nr:hypothetical protein GW17_00055788 [Ensete ventricosum]